MIRGFLVLSLICCVCVSFIYQTKVNKQPKHDVILWNSATKLKWEDFKGKLDEKSEYKAMTYVQIGLDSKEDQNYINVDVPCYFIKNLSWTKEKSLSILKHEQLHFDIAELISRRIRKEFVNYKSTNIQKTYNDLQEIYRIHYRIKLDSINSKYDTETNHSINIEKQKEWELKIAKELKSLDKYSTTKIVIKREKTMVKPQEKKR